MQLRRLPVVVLIVCSVATLSAQARQAPPTQPFDILIKGGRVFDGAGNPAFPADVGVREGKIVAVGRLGGAAAARVIDAAGMFVAPGFIDIHSHADDGARAGGGFRDANAHVRAAPNLVTQGITTVVVNHDGRSPWPISAQRALIERNGIGPNTMLMVGHGAVRSQVMGRDARRVATAGEVAKMRALVRQGLEEGAVGLSAGLEYEPGRWSETAEVVELAQELPAFDGVYISHERSEGSDPLWYVPSQDGPGPPTLLDAVRETIEIGERSGARVVASHIKAKGANYWGSSGAAISLIERARERGVDVWADQYPYPTSGTDGSTVLIPGWAIRVEGSGRAEALRQVLADPARAKTVRSDIAHEIARRGGADNVTVYDYTDKSLYGKPLAEIAKRWGVDPIEAAIRIQLEGLPNRPGGARMRGFSMHETDMEAFARQPWVATSTDAGIALPDAGPSTHARFYGSFPRKIRHYALERRAISVEHAIRSSTSLPALIMGLKDRGLIREGLAADIVVFDLATVRDKATFFEPHQYSEGIDYVLVNGVPVVDAGKITWALPGKLITRQPAQKGAPIFDGKTFAGWEGDRAIFRIEEGAIVGGTLKNKIARNEFLCTTQTYGDFELRLKVKLLGGDRANAGIQFRTARIPNHHEVSGYQADMGVGWWGALYDESRRNKVLKGPDQEKMKSVVRMDDWNDYVVRAEGPRIQLWLNGTPTVDYVEEDPKIEKSGVICVQIHGGPPSEAWYKEITLVDLSKK